MAYIGIDTNVFEHLLNLDEDHNHDAHIDRLLGALIGLKCLLLVDSTKKIGNEYQQKIIPIIRNMDETRPQGPLLRYWMDDRNKHQVDLNPKDTLMQRIRGVIHEHDEHADRAFVYVVFRKDSMLVTNDRVHILSRARDLLRKTKSAGRGRRASIMTSQDAVACVCAIGDIA